METARGSELVCASVSGRRVPLPLFEALSFPRDQLEATLLDLRARSGARELCIISTCERVEIYAAGFGAEAMSSSLLDALAGNRGVSPRAVKEAARTCSDGDAARHLLRVTSGLESFVLGERDIVGQVRAAVEASRTAGVMGWALERLMATAVNTSRRVHRSTGLGAAGRSVARAAVQFASLENGGELAGQRVLVVGAGDVAIQVADSAAHLGATVTVCNRTRRNAERWVAAGVTVVDLGRLLEALSTTDVAIFGTAAPEALVSAAELDEARGTSGRRLLVLDLCVPRNVDSAVRELRGVRLLDLGDLRAAGRPESETVVRDVTTAECIIAEELDRHARRVARRDAAPAVRRLRDDIEACVRIQVEQATEGVADEDRPVVEDQVRRAHRKLSHQATQRLLQAAEAGDARLVEVLAGSYATAPSTGSRASTAERSSP
ncbi:MAG: glutamyl-tRNA reductase [Nocardioides sp.]